MSQNPAMPSNADVQQLMYVFEILENQEKSLRQQISMLETQTQGIELSRTTMEEFRNIEPGHETLIPVGSNAYTTATLVNPKKVVVRINSEILIEKNLEAGIENVIKILESYKIFRENLTTQLAEVHGKLTQLRPQVEQIYRQQNR